MFVELLCIAVVSLYVTDVSRTAYKLCRSI